MLYSEFLEGTGAVDNQETYNEYKRVERIYMDAPTMTKEDAYRMAVVLTEKEAQKIQKKAQKQEIEWVLDNVIPAAAFIRGMSEKTNYLQVSKVFRSDCGNLYELRKEGDVNGRYDLFVLYINGKKADLGENYLIPSPEIHSYRARWQGKSREELEDLFGYIA